MPYEFKHTRRVEFADTDTAGIMHFSNFFRFMEASEHAFFRSLGFSIHSREAENRIGWPRVHAACDYKLPLHFEDVVEIHLLVREKKPKSLSYSFIIRKVNEHPVREVARGAMTVVCVQWDAVHGKMRAVPIPREIADQIEVAPPELLAEKETR
ncbi:MAG: acyl-CoA thioesterase [Armatimonadota bacterium]|nr:acyl-CoA thioesterase [Armatimonadota bacterium]